MLGDPSGNLNADDSAEPTIAQRELNYVEYFFPEAEEAEGESTDKLRCGEAQVTETTDPAAMQFPEGAVALRFYRAAEVRHLLNGSWKLASAKRVWESPMIPITRTRFKR